MNLFQKYGIKEVADVTFYSITKIGDEEFYTPVLFLDTLKVSTLEHSSSNVEASGGYANQKLISWNFGKTITLSLEDALFSQASMNMTFGWLNSKLSKYTSAIAKINLANKYGLLNYSIYAYPSPELTDEEWEIVYFAIYKAFYINDKDIIGLTKEFIEMPHVAEERIKFKKYYKNRTYPNDNINCALPQKVITEIFNQIQYINQLGSIDTDNYELEIIDRFEKCYVDNKNGLSIDVEQQYNNLLKYYSNDKTSSYIIYYDIKTMQPLILKDSNLLVPREGTIKIKEGTSYYKWSRTVKPKIGENNILGKTLIIDSTTFPSEFKIVGETYIREQKTNRDQRYQFIINRASISTDTNVTLEADGGPTTFSMKIDVLSPPNELMMELQQFDIDKDDACGGTKIIPQNTKYSYTPVNIDIKRDTIENDEIY